MSHVVLKPTRKPSLSMVDKLQDAAEELWMSVFREKGWDDNAKAKKYTHGRFY